MSTRAREHVPALAAVLSVVSLAAVFGAALRVIPASLLPRAPEAVLSAIPHANAAISAAAIATIAFGWRSIRAGRVRRHRRAMSLALVLFFLFLALYLYKVALEGPTPFPGPDPVYRFFYLPLLVVHVGLAVVCVPLLYYVVLLAVTRPVGRIPDTPHPRVGRIAASLWIVSFAGGILVYALLYHAF